MDLQKSIKVGDISNLYIFTGEETAILEIYIRKLVNIFGSYLVSDSVSDLRNVLNKKSLIDIGKKLYIIRDDKDFVSTDVMWDKLEEKLNSKNIVLIVKYVSIDARSKFYKRFQDSITVFDKLSESVLMKYVMKDLSIPEDYAQYLVNICNRDYSRILLEINKIKNVSGYYSTDDKSAFRLCANANVFHIEQEGEVFDLIDSIMLRDVKSSYKLLRESYDRGDSPLLILTLLHSNVKATLQIQIAGKGEKLTEFTGLNNMQIKTAYRYLNRYSSEELVRFMKVINYCEKSAKNGVLSNDNVIEFLLAQVI